MIGEIKTSVKREASANVNSMFFCKSHEKKYLTTRFIYIFFAIVILFILFVVLTVFSYKASIDVTPKSYTVNINDSFPIYSSPRNGELSFDVIELKYIAKKPLTPSIVELSKTRAKGTVVLYNEEELQQKLSPNTRLKSDFGNIYYLDDKELTIPPSIDGKPGILKTVIYAESDGDGYEIEDGEKLIFAGWEESGSKKIKTQYGIIRDDVKGRYRMDSENSNKFIYDLLDSEIEKVLDERANKYSIDGFISIPCFDSLTFDHVGISKHEDGSFDISQGGKLSVVLINEMDFVEYLGERKISDFGFFSTGIHNLDEIKFSVVPTQDGLIRDVLSARVLVNGNLELVVDFNEYKEDFLDELHGVKEKDVSLITASFEMIDSVVVRVSPFWRRSIPENTERIILKIIDPFIST